MTEVLGNVDVGASKVLVGVSSLNGALDEGSIRSFATPATSEELIRLTAAALRDAAGSDSYLRIGCVAPGPIDYVHGVIARMHNKAWAPVPIVAKLQESFSCEIRLEDDAAGAALAEALVGAGAGRDPVAYVTVSSGVGSGLVVNGESFRGAHGTAGEVGHLVVDAAGPQCNCGRSGDIESFAGGMSLLRQVVALWPEPQDPESVERSPAELFERAAAGDPRALEIRDRGRDALARGFAAIATIWDPELIVVGGSVALGQPRWIEESFDVARELCMAEVGRATEFAPATLGERSALIGAGLLAVKPVAASRGPYVQRGQSEVTTSSGHSNV